MKTQTRLPAGTREPALPTQVTGAPALGVRHLLLAGLLLAAATVLPYVRTWRYDLIYLDDVFFVREGRWFFEDWHNLPKVFTNHVWEFFGQESSLYRPLLLLPRFFEVALFGTSPGPYHVLNTGLHFASVLVLFALLLRLIGDLRASLVAALLFALHPAHVPAIAWIEGNNNTMTALFVLAAVLLVLLAVQTGRVRYGLLSGATWLLALLTKESAVATPLLALGVVWLWRSSDGRKADSVHLNPRLLGPTAAAWGLAFVTWFVLRAHAIPETPELESDYLRASVGRGWPGLLLYWGKVFLPFNLVPLPILRDSALWLGIAATAIYGYALARARRGNRRALVLAVLWFGLLISPSLLVSRLETPSGAIFREDRMYQASIGVFIALAFLLRGFLAKHRRPTLAVAAVCAAAWLALGQARMGHYADGMSYWTAAVKGSPSLSLAHQLLAVMHHRAGDFASEKAELMRALQLNPRLDGLNNDVGAMLIREGSYAEADRHFQAELMLYPDAEKAHYNRGLLKFHFKEYAAAAEHLNRYLQLTKDPEDSSLRRNARAMLTDMEGASRSMKERQLAEEPPARKPGGTT